MIKDPHILYEDANLLVIDKPVGISVHRDKFSSEETIADWFVGQYPEVSQVGEPLLLEDGTEVPKPGVVHRLDKETSGALLLAKNQPTFLYLKRQFQERKIKKTYRLIVNGRINLPVGKKEGVINLPIGRSRNDARIRVASPKAVGVLREAITYYQVLENLGKYSHVEAHPVTGRTHQLRAHFKAIQHPIACDNLYAKGLPCLPGLDRLALHAYKIRFVLPQAGELEVEAPVPSDFQTALDNLKSV